MSMEVWLSLLLGAVITIIVALIIYLVQKKESSAHKHEHDAKLAEIKLLHQQDSEKIRVLYELIVQSQKGSIGEIEAAVLEQKIEIAAEQITEQDSDQAQALKAIAEKDKDKADDLLDKIAEQEHNLVEMYKLRVLNEFRNGFYNEAVKWSRKILELIPEDFNAKIDLTTNLLYAGQHEEVHRICEKMMSELQSQENPDPESMIAIYKSWVESYHDFVYNEEREKYYKLLLSLVRQHYGENSVDIFRVLALQSITRTTEDVLREREENYLKFLSAVDSGKVGESEWFYTIYANIIALYYQQGRYEEALPLIEKARKIIISYLGPEHPEMAMPLCYRAYIHAQCGEYDEAEVLFKQALDLMESKLGKDHNNYLIALSNLAGIYVATQRCAEAEAIFREIIETLSNKESEDGYLLGRNEYFLASCLYEQGKFEEAEFYYEKALDVWSKLLDEQNPDLLNLMSDTYNVYNRRGKYNQAEQGFQKLIILYNEIGWENTFNMAVARNHLSISLLKQKRFAEAEAYSRQALDYVRENMPDTICCTRYMSNYAEIISQLGKTEEAEQYKARASELNARLEALQKQSKQ